VFTPHSALRNPHVVYDARQHNGMGHFSWRQPLYTTLASVVVAVCAGVLAITQGLC
jgi:hypothetical protein